MDATYPIESFPHVSSLIDFKEYFSQYTQALQSSIYDHASNDREFDEEERDMAKIAQLMNRNQDQVKLIANKCSLALLGPVEDNSPVKNTDPENANDLLHDSPSLPVSLGSVKNIGQMKKGSVTAHVSRPNSAADSPLVPAGDDTPVRKFGLQKKDSENGSPPILEAVSLLVGANTPVKNASHTKKDSENPDGSRPSSRAGSRATNSRANSRANSRNSSRANSKASSRANSAADSENESEHPPTCAPSSIIQELDKASVYLATAVYQKCELLKPGLHMKKIKLLKNSALPTFPVDERPTTPLSETPTDYLLTARVFKPFTYKSRNPIMHLQDFLLHSSTYLSEFRDKVVCRNDEIDFHETFWDKDQTAHNPMKEVLKSSMFYFGNTMYRDDRDTLCKDYGRAIDQWARDNPRFKLGPFEHKSMQTTRIDQLGPIRLGYPYVFIHLGSCEHIVVFIDARLTTPFDPQDLSLYPLVDNVAQPPMHCVICDTYESSWVVQDFELLPKVESVLCYRCFRSFCFKKNGEKKGTFSYYPYTGSAKNASAMDAAPQENVSDGEDRNMMETPDLE